MKFALRHTLKLPALSCSLLLPVLIGAAACGEEAPLPTINNGAGQGTAGTSVAASGSGGMSAAAGTGTTPTAGTGTTPTGGTGTTPEGGTGSGGTGTTGGTGMTSGGMSAAGSGTGGMAGGAAGGSAGAGGGGGGDIKAMVAGKLDGAMLTGKCINDTAQSVCQTSNNGCPAYNNADPPLSGVITTDTTITLGGDPAKVYTITLHVQGEVEAKQYNGGMDQSSSGQSPKMDGFCVGGVPSKDNAYNVYMARVSSPKQDYFFNSVDPPGVSNHTTYGIDYTAKIKANGGATVRLVAADSNCSMIKNCGPTQNSGNMCAAPIVLQNMDPVAVAKNPSFDFTKAFNGQWIVMVVTDVTEN